MYDPNCETTNAEKVIAGQWELLRRNTEFRSIAKRWLASEQFRREHVLSPAYHDMQYHVPRCALDWMLTAERRVELAAYQIEKLHWFFDLDFNFGPVICYENFSAALVTKDNWLNFLSLKAKFNPPPPVTVDHPWDRTPDLFKQHFRHAGGTMQKFDEINPYLKTLGKELREIAKKLAIGDPSIQNPLYANKVFKLGSGLLETAEFCKVFKVPTERRSEKTFSSFLSQIHASFKSANLFIPTKKYDLHASYQGTADDWRWFLEAESLGLDVHKSADAAKLAEIYSEALRQRVVRGHAPRRAKALGHAGSKFPSRGINAALPASFNTR